MIAGLLPFYFAWTLVACVALCSEHARESHEPRAGGAAVAVNGLDESDCCPILGTPASLLPERSTLISRASGDCNGLPVDSEHARNRAHGSFVSALASTSYHSPPFERSCVLRV
ncbi:MAG TPA: hypothetical protein VE262_25300 [Blastocatellia bacterium]|nr:hypothetical protein [Blastocatellia bacterium]